MQVDLEVEGTQVAGLPRFQQAAAQGRRLRRLAIGLGALAGAGWVLAFFVGLFAPQSLWLPLLINQSAALLVVVAGLQSAWWVTQWRARRMNPLSAMPLTVDEQTAADGWYERLLDRLSRRSVHLLGLIGAATLWLGGWALLIVLSTAGVEPALRPRLSVSLHSRRRLALYCVCLLVLERHWLRKTLRNGLKRVRWPN